jgi:hypothetical protein
MLADCVSPAVTVNVVAVPIAVPAALKKEILPVQDAGVGVEVDVVLVPVVAVGFSARFTTLTCMVSLRASPTGGKLAFRVTEGGVVATGWASAVWATAPAAKVRVSNSLEFRITLTTSQSVNSFTENGR